MAVNVTGTQMINLTLDDLRHNQHGKLSERQRGIVLQQRRAWIAGAAAFVLICGTLFVAVSAKLLVPAFMSWLELVPWLPAALLWLWLLRSSFVQWRYAVNDLLQRRIDVLEGRVHCELNFGIGIIRVPRYHILIDEHKFSVGKHIFFQFKNGEHYRVFYAPSASILLGAVQLVPSQTFLAHAANTDQLVVPAGGSTSVATDDSLRSSEDAVGEPHSEDPSALIEPLTQHEKAIVLLIAQGLSNKEIAKELALSTNTIKMYTSHLYRKLGVRRRTEAVAKARHMRIL